MLEKNLISFLGKRSFPDQILYGLIAYQQFKYADMTFWRLKPYENLNAPVKYPDRRGWSRSTTTLPTSPLGLYTEIHRKNYVIKRHRFSSKKHVKSNISVQKSRIRRDLLVSFDRRESVLKKIKSNQT